MELQFDYLDLDTTERLLKSFPGYHDGFVRCQPGNLLMPVFYQKDCKNYSHFKIRSDDIFVLSFPKSGKLQCIPDAVCYLAYFEFVHNFM